MVSEASTFENQEAEEEEETETAPWEDIPEGEEEREGTIDTFAAEDGEEEYFDVPDTEEESEDETVIFAGEEEQWISEEEAPEEEADDEDSTAPITVMSEGKNDTEEPAAEEDFTDQETVEAHEEIFPLVVKKRKHKVTADEASVLVQNNAEETDVLKHPLPKGQKVSASFFLKRNRSKKSGDGDENQNTAITAWRAVLHHTRWTFIGLVCMAIVTLFLGVLECISPVKNLIFSF